MVAPGKTPEGANPAVKTQRAAKIEAAILSIQTADAASAIKKPDPSTYLDHNGRPLYLTENVKGASGSNKWMWENAMLIMPTRHESKSSACLGAWCLQCEIVHGKSVNECYISYHPTRNFKSLTRHFKRHHADLQDGSSAKAED